MEQQQPFDEQYMSESNVFAADSRLFVQFYRRAVQNKFKSDQQGRPIFDEIDYVKIIVPGDKNTVIDSPASEEHKFRFEKQWDRYKRGQEQASEGTPLEAVTWLTV